MTTFNETVIVQNHAIILLLSDLVGAPNITPITRSIVRLATKASKEWLKQVDEQ